MLSVSNVRATGKTHGFILLTDNSIMKRYTKSKPDNLVHMH